MKLTLQSDSHFLFSAASGPDKIPYEVDFELCDKVNVEVIALMRLYFRFYHYQSIGAHSNFTYECIAGEQGYYWLEKHVLSCEEGCEEMVEEAVKTRREPPCVSSEFFLLPIFLAIVFF